MLTTSLFWMLIANNRYLFNLLTLILSTLIINSIISINYSVKYMEQTSLLFNSYSSYDNLTLTILVISSLIAIWLISSYSFDLNLISRKLNNEFLTLIILLMIAMAALSSANSYLTLFVAVEVQSLVLYIMLATNINKTLNDNLSKVSLSYLINAAMATALLLFGMSVNSNQLILIAILWKLGVVPVHAWSLPILDNQNNIIVSIYLTLSKYGILMIIALIASSNLICIEMLTYIGLLNLTLGNVLGLLQFRYQRIIVYSSLIQIGYILLILSNYSSLGLGYFELYSFYTVMLLLLWINPVYNLFNSARLISKINVWIMVLVLYTVAGLPFFPLFWTKLDILLEIKSESLIIALVSTLLSSLIYVRLIKYISFFKMSNWTYT